MPEFQEKTFKYPRQHIDKKIATLYGLILYGESWGKYMS